MNPSFISVQRDPLALFPIERMRPYFKSAAVQPKVISEKWEDSVVRLRLVDQNSTDELARLQLGLRDSLSNVSKFQNFMASVFYQHCVLPSSQTSTSGSLISYSGLKPFCQIEDYFLGPEFRHNRIGGYWYHEKIEPFLRGAGIGMAATFGNCHKRDDASGFWTRIGFNKIVIDVEFDFGFDIEHYLLARSIFPHTTSLADKAATLLHSSQAILARLCTWRGGEFAGAFKEVARCMFPLHPDFSVFQQVEFRDFSQFPRSLVTIDQDFIARVLLAACLIAEDPAKYLNYHYLNDPKYDGQKARLPDGTIRTSQSTPPSDFFNTAAGEKLIIEKSNDGKDIIFIRQKGEEPFSQIFFIFTMQQLNDLLRAESISDPQTLFKTNLLALFQLRIPK